MLLVFVLAVMQTWVHLYQEACALKHAALAKHVAKGCDGQGLFSAAKDFLGGFFYGVQDPCEVYYLAALVDPAWEVGLQVGLENINFPVNIVEFFGDYRVYLRKYFSFA